MEERTTYHVDFCTCFESFPCQHYVTKTTNTYKDGVIVKLGSVNKIMLGGIEIVNLIVQKKITKIKYSELTHFEYLINRLDEKTRNEYTKMLQKAKEAEKNKSPTILIHSNDIYWNKVFSNKSKEITCYKSVDRLPTDDNICVHKCEQMSKNMFSFSKSQHTMYNALTQYNTYLLDVYAIKNNKKYIPKCIKFLDFNKNIIKTKYRNFYESKEYQDTLFFYNGFPIFNNNKYFFEICDNNDVDELYIKCGNENSNKRLCYKLSDLNNKKFNYSIKNIQSNEYNIIFENDACKNKYVLRGV